MKLQMKTVTHVLGMLTAAAFFQTAALADDSMVASANTNSSPVTADTRYGFLDGLDHRSSYGQFLYPEPFLVDESDVDNEVRLDWLHTEANAQQNDDVKLELE